MRSSWKPLYLNGLVINSRRKVVVANSIYFFLLNNLKKKYIYNSSIFVSTRNCVIIDLFQLFSVIKTSNGYKFKNYFKLTNKFDNLDKKGFKFGEFFLTRKKAVFNKPKIKQKKNASRR